MAAIHYDSFSRAYNKWLDYYADFRKEFDDSMGMSTVLKTIFGFLNKNLSHSIDDPDHPFRRYADADKTNEENYGVLAMDVMQQIQEVYLRGYVHAFFHTSGANYDDMKELMGEYFLFADRSEDEDYSDDTTVSDSDSEDEDDTDDTDDTGDVQSEQDSSNPNNSPH